MVKDLGLLPESSPIFVVQYDNIQNISIGWN